MRHIASYGSLRAGYWNHARFHLDKAKRLPDATIKGAMFRCGSSDAWYPHLFEAGKLDASLEREHVIEIYEVSDEIHQGIVWMESGAGYYSKEIEVSGVKATIFYADPEEIEAVAERHVESYNCPKTEE